MKLLGLNNFYDYCADPNKKDSNEKRFEKIEENLGDEVDKLVTGNSYDSRKIIQYISFLDSRSLSKRILIEQFQPYKSNPAYANSLDAVKEFHQNITYSSLSFISTYDIDEYKLKVVKADKGYEFCTSDSPVVEYPCQISKAFVEGYPLNYPDYPVFVCPLNQNIAAIAIHKDDYVTEQIIDSGYFSSKKTRIINSLMITFATDALCFTHEPDNYDLEIFRDPNHPRNYYLNSYLKTISKSPKKIKQKFLKTTPPS